VDGIPKCQAWGNLRRSWCNGSFVQSFDSSIFTFEVSHMYRISRNGQEPIVDVDQVDVDQVEAIEPAIRSCEPGRR
jgi:hypothetical protein